MSAAVVKPFKIFNDFENKENIDPLTGICSNTKPNIFTSKKRVPLRDITPVTTKYPTSPKKSRQVAVDLASNYIPPVFNLQISSNVPATKKPINNGFNFINGNSNGSFSIYHDVPTSSVKTIR
ncbi:hypothetical protein DDB_G0288575 [Dictyostelium discoideum AX4]|uniref:Putative uncharacterized protein DDB_G0288575 n=1 Tax=Dictyostelium discoideum TaxID=44689 RepID=Y8000_DICDI|nr:hypothetical protein DDB_G0288575 [Dictyostelium discoideum AX4]Q54IR4.1 RecName: Full=Putative uncharacterized protein DDB_G0288575 [Dictyostelium discoideum]EAL63147.1 hypothetical protein DDB_G0288575 [Dictyostelium discoideum AX4]|eukprot:XP_636650.1 hypothetical protein DDB_G0288575 [Dictyostelium discoideum AX4]